MTSRDSSILHLQAAASMRNDAESATVKQLHEQVCYVLFVLHS